MPEKAASRSTADSGIPDKILDYITKHGSSTSFTRFFWKRCEPHPSELKRYPMYVDTLRLVAGGMSLAETARMTGVKSRSVGNWVTFRQKPKLAHFLSLFLELGEPMSGWVWLSVNNTSGHAVPLGPMIQVPETISDWRDVERVLEQLGSLKEIGPEFSREYAFGFLLGMAIGDSAKSRTKNWHRHLGLVMSKKYATNEDIGEFTSLCAQRLGVRMHRVADIPRPKHKPHGFYQWVSQASPLIDWIFNVCLGLKDGEGTTYDAVRMDWATSAPEDFRRGLVQGIAESDGSVAIASQTVEFWIGPNWDFFQQVLLTFGVKSFRSREALSVTKTQIAILGRIPPFAPHLKTARYRRFEKLVHARHIERGRRVPSEIREFIIANCNEASVPELLEQVLDRFGVILAYETVQRWTRKGLNQASAG